MQQPADAECSVCTLDGLQNVINTAASDIKDHAVVVAAKDEEIAACDDQLREAQAETEAVRAEFADVGSHLWAWSAEECLRRSNE